MRCDCARSIPQCILSFTNSIFLFVGLLLLLVGCILLVAPNQVVYLIGSLANEEENQVMRTLVSLSTPLVLQEIGKCLLGLSVVILPLCLCGYLGSLRLNSPLLILYSLLILVIWSVQLVLLICLPFIKNKLILAADWLINISLQHYRGNSAEENLVTVLWNHVMSTFSCCGYSNYMDFQDSISFRHTKVKNQIVPESCCILESSMYPSLISPKDENCIFTPTKYNSYFVQGCRESFEDFFIANFDIIVLTVIFIITIEITVVILSACLCMLKPPEQVYSLQINRSLEHLESNGAQIKQ